MKTFVARNVEELEPILEAFLETFPGGGQFRLEGEMGAGKTTFVSALCRKLGIDDASSPTFSLVNEYVDAQGRSVYHYDLYRLRNLEEALDVGLDVMVDRPGYHFIEWPQVADRLLDATTVSIEVSDDCRVIKF